ncbi:hypothetical protein JCM19239_5682 [Vibrio variabilis]|uniref:Nitrous oxide-stimulated promoter n=1 Tax=Vibrio variabilis TaxID=990271 RepID=A0ABQ0JMA0_9VIBR|nr:hypothetical protein JCM19239_5682 [Vibrio variabilis]
MKKSSEILVGELETEFKTVVAMMKIYCKQHHGSSTLCQQCRELLVYAETKLDRCPYGESKPTCNKCPIHCYKPEEKKADESRDALRRAAHVATTSDFVDSTSSA